MKKNIFVLFVVAICCGAVSSAVAQDKLPLDNGINDYFAQPDWRESESSLVRTAAYIVHPVGWVLREVVYRPFSYLVSSNETASSVFGYRDPYDFRNRDRICYSDNGIPDCRKMAPYNSIGMNYDTDGSDVIDLNDAEQVHFPDIAFDFDKHNLNSLGKARAAQAAKLLGDLPELTVVIEGHTDYIGSDDYNNALGERRASTVKKELSELGIDPSRLKIISRGEGEPLFTEKSDWARAANRRAHIRVEEVVVD